MGGLLDRLTAVINWGPEQERDVSVESQEPASFAHHDEQLLEHLNNEHAGINWQQDLQNEIGWSSSKTSRILTQLEADERIIRYRIGRQKLVSVPDTDPEVVSKYFADYLDPTEVNV